MYIESKNICFSLFKTETNFLCFNPRQKQNNFLTFDPLSSNGQQLYHKISAFALISEKMDFNQSFDTKILFFQPSSELWTIL